ncbi:potassium channel family protein [Actinomadura scrupuli]|uniref:potassium channel family protein n=1 Tax=Actinomadura scrupuli TaxID=559629 RepID=UPI003D9536B6
MSGVEYEDWYGHIIVCGLHGLGMRIVEQLRHAGERVVVVDDEADVRLARVVIGWGVPHLTGNAALPETLAEAGLAGAAAVICVERTDLQNLEISLQAQQLRPGLRVITHIRNRAVGRALSADSGPGAVLDVAALSAPSVVEACLREAVHRLDLGGTEFLVGYGEAGRTGTLRELFGTLIPLAVTPSEGGEVEICPGRDHRVRSGDRVTLVGTEPELLEHGIVIGHRPTAHRRPGTPRWAAPLHWLRAAGAADDSRGLRRALSGLALLVVVSTMVLWRGYREPGMSPLDGLYFSVETIATVGFGDFSFAEQPTWLRVYAIALMVLGVTGTAVVLAYLTDLLVSRRIERSYGRRLAAGMSGHIVVAGLGTVGAEVMTALRARGHDVVVIEFSDDNRFLAQAHALGVPVVYGDATLPATLEAANLAHASAVAVLTSDDMINIEAGLTLRDVLGERWSTTPVVLRIFERTLAHTLADRFGFHHVRSTAELAAPWFVGAALGLEILGTFTAQERPFLAGRFTIEPGGGLDGLTMQELSGRTKVVAIRRSDGALEHPPRRHTRFRSGDQAFVIGPYEELLTVLRRGHRRVPG